MTYKFQSLTNARNFVNRTSKNYFIFNAPDSGFLVVDARTANQLWAGGLEDIR